MIVPHHQKSIYATDFSEYPLSGQLKDNGWTEQGVSGAVSDGTYTVTTDANGISDRGVAVSQGVANQYRAISWDQVGDITDFEILALIKLSALPDATGGGGVSRVNGASSGYDATFNSSGSPESVHISQFTTGFIDSTLVSQNVALDTTNLFWLRFRGSSTTYGIACWQHGSAEPALTSVVDSTYSAGRVAIQTVEKKGFTVYWYSVATGGAKAPGPAG